MVKRSALSKALKRSALVGEANADVRLLDDRPSLGNSPRTSHGKGLRGYRRSGSLPRLPYSVREELEKSYDLAPYLSSALFAPRGKSQTANDREFVRPSDPPREADPKMPLGKKILDSAKSEGGWTRTPRDPPAGPSRAEAVEPRASSYARHPLGPRIVPTDAIALLGLADEAVRPWQLAVPAHPLSTFPATRPERRGENKDRHGVPFEIFYPFLPLCHRISGLRTAP